MKDLKDTWGNVTLHHVQLLPELVGKRRSEASVTTFIFVPGAGNLCEVLQKPGCQVALLSFYDK
jgi:hypothetical protein